MEKRHRRGLVSFLFLLINFNLYAKLIPVMQAKNLIITPAKSEERKKLDIKAGDTVKVWQKIKEKDKFRLQVLEGLVLSVKHGKEAGGTFTVRKIASGVGMERIFPIYSPMIEKIEIVKRSKVRRAKLYHIREKAAKEIRRQMRKVKNLPDFVSVDESEEEKIEEISEVKEENPEATENTNREAETKKENPEEVK